MAKKNRARAAGASGSRLGATGGVAKPPNRKQQNRTKILAHIATKIAKQPPNICVALQWGKSLVVDVDEILGLPSQMSLHGVSGTKVVPPVSNPPMQNPPMSPVVFDQAFPGEEGMKYRMMALWYNAKTNRFQGKNRYKQHHHDLWEWQCRGHAMQLFMTQSQYFDLGLRVLEHVKKTLQKGIRKCRDSISFGDTDSRELDVEGLLQHLRDKKGISGSIHVKQRDMTPPGVTSGSQQILHELRLYLDPTRIDHLDSSSFIDPPEYSQSEVQGNYEPGKPVYLV